MKCVCVYVCVCVCACVRACVRVCNFRKTRTNYNPSVFGNHYFSDSAPTLIALLPPYLKKKSNRVTIPSLSLKS